MYSTSIIALLLCILVAAALSRRIEGTIITMPMVYTAMGLAIGAQGLGLFLLEPFSELVEIIAEVTLIIVLASDAARISLRDIKRHHSIPLRLLGIGLPLTMIAGTGIAWLMFGELGFWGAAVIAVVLAPTDASLGQLVVSNPKVPLRIRQALNIESGLNDGIAMPFLLFAISLAVANEEHMQAGEFMASTLMTVLLAVVAGAVIGWLGVKFIAWGRKSSWMSLPFQKISGITLALLTYGVAEMIGGNGFIAAFLFGLTSGNFYDADEGKIINDFVEIEVKLLILLTFVLFGAVMLPPALDNISPKIVLYAILSLTLVRMIPVAVSLMGSTVRINTNLFIGWFGPRGTASVLYIFTALESADMIIGIDQIYAIAMITVLVSVFAHGISAAPLSDRYGRKMADGDAAEMMEHEHVPEMPLRVKSNI